MHQIRLNLANSQHVAGQGRRGVAHTVAVHVAIPATGIFIAFNAFGIVKRVAGVRLKRMEQAQRMTTSWAIVTMSLGLETLPGPAKLT